MQKPNDTAAVNAALQNLYSLVCAIHAVEKLGRLDTEIHGDTAQNMAYLLRIFGTILEDNYCVLNDAFPRNCTCSAGDAS